MSECRMSRLLGPYVDGELSRAEEHRLTEHIKRCEACDKALAEEMALISLLGRLETAPSHGEIGVLEQRVLQAIAGEPPGSGDFLFGLWERPVPALLTSVALALYLLHAVSRVYPIDTKILVEALIKVAF